jgi:uncharacterized iron-regulated protein
MKRVEIMKKIMRIVIIIYLAINLVFSFMVLFHVQGIRLIRAGDNHLKPDIYQNQLVIIKAYDNYAKDDIVVLKSEDMYTMDYIYDIDSYLVTTINKQDNEINNPVSTENIIGKVTYKVSTFYLLIYMFLTFISFAYLFFDIFTSLKNSKSI